MTLLLFANRFISFSQMSIFLPWQLLEWSNAASVLWGSLVSSFTQLTATWWLRTSSVFSSPNSSTGYPNPNETTQPLPHGLSVWGRHMHESHLSCIQMINLSLPVSTYLLRVSFRTVKWDSRIGFSIWVDSVLLAFNFILNFLVVTRDPVPGHILKTWQPSGIEIADLTHGHCRQWLGPAQTSSSQRCDSSGCRYYSGSFQFIFVFGWWGKSVDFLK